MLALMSCLGSLESGLRSELVIFSRLGRVNDFLLGSLGSKLGEVLVAFHNGKRRTISNPSFGR